MKRVAMTELENNKAVVMKYVEAFNSFDEQALREIFFADALIYGVLCWGGADGTFFTINHTFFGKKK